MRIGVISDVHANLAALEAVLDALARERVESIVHAGDVVGYGPQPDECIALLRERDVASVSGNHDLAVLGQVDAGRWAGIPREVIAWTTAHLSDDGRAWLASLPLRLELDGVTVAHGSLDSAEEYVVTSEQSDAQLARVDGILVLGHTHVPQWHGGRLLNPGSVGQTRDGRIVARYAVLDGTRAELRETAYDVGRTRRALRDAGLPRETFRWPPPLWVRAERRLRR